jgi:hypothetical protein
MGRLWIRNYVIHLYLVQDDKRSGNRTGAWLCGAGWRKRLHVYMASFDDRGLQVYAEVTAHNAYGASAPSRSSSAEIQDNVAHPPCDVPDPLLNQAPAIWGSDLIGDLISTTPGEWHACGGGIAGYAFQWRRNAAAIAGATNQVYETTPSDAGQTLSVAVTAYAFNGRAYAVSNNFPVSTSSLPSEPSYPPGQPGTGTFACFGPRASGSVCQADGYHNQFGGRFVLGDGLNLRGVRSTIRTPSTHHFVLPYRTAAVMRVAAEQAPGLIQVGFGRAYRINIGNCGLTAEENKLYTYFESMTVSGGGESQVCQWLDRIPLKATRLFTVYRRNQSAAGNTTTWRTRIDGADDIHTRNVGFDTASNVEAGGEIAADWAIFDFVCCPDGELWGAYGLTPSPKFGIRPWQLTQAAGSSGWRAVAPSEAEDVTTENAIQDDRWTITSTSASAFILKHVCHPDHDFGC